VVAILGGNLVLHASYYFLRKLSVQLGTNIYHYQLPVLGGVRSTMEGAGRILKMERQYLPAYMKNLKVANAQ
jgi:hypothetical protein